MLIFLTVSFRRKTKLITIHLRTTAFKLMLRHRYLYFTNKIAVNIVTDIAINNISIFFARRQRFPRLIEYSS